jgi:hypothetical protein
VLVCNSAFQFRREGLRIALNLFDQAAVPHPMQVVKMAALDHVAVVSSPVPVILVVQRLMQVADEVNDKLQRFRLGCPPALGSLRTARNCSVLPITRLR